ncbi:hypothetical protein DFH09DRAFT_1459383 [Mycena vulgaris]|nr:hypothetical protein DFH09DRAFT_1459383 [Mycena vulgaris]
MGGSRIGRRWENRVKHRRATVLAADSSSAQSLRLRAPPRVVHLPKIVRVVRSTATTGTAPIAPRASLHFNAIRGLTPHSRTRSSDPLRATSCDEIARIEPRERSRAGITVCSLECGTRASRCMLRSLECGVPRSSSLERRSGLLPSAAHEGLEWEERTRRISAHRVSCTPALHPASARQHRLPALRERRGLYSCSSQRTRASSRERMPSRAAVLDPGAARPSARDSCERAATPGASGPALRTSPYTALVGGRSSRPVSTALCIHAARNARTRAPFREPAPHYALATSAGLVLLVAPRCSPRVHPARAAHAEFRRRRMEMGAREEGTHRLGISTRGSCTVWSDNIPVLKAERFVLAGLPRGASTAEGNVFSREHHAVTEERE